VGPEKGRCEPGLKRAVLLHGLDIVKTACGRIPQVNLFFSIYLILSAALGPGVYRASNRNKYLK
jgi:hypothetical protein